MCGISLTQQYFWAIAAPGSLPFEHEGERFPARHSNVQATLFQL